MDQHSQKAPKEWDSPKRSPGKDTAVQAARYTCYEAVTTACRGNEEGRVKSHVHAAHGGLSRRIALQEWKAVEDNTKSLMGAAADDTGASPFAVDFPRPYPSANRRACKSKGSM